MFWLTALLVIIGAVGIWLAYKQYSLSKKSPKIMIEEISANPWKVNGAGGWISSCYIILSVINPSTENNEIEIKIASPDAFIVLANKKKIVLPALKTTPIRIEFNHEICNSEEAINKIRGKILLLKIEDIHGHKTSQKFIFEDVA